MCTSRLCATIRCSSARSRNATPACKTAPSAAPGCCRGCPTTTTRGAIIPKRTCLTGVAQALFADESFRDKSQALLVRVLSYYTQALFAQDQIEIARAKKNAFEQQFQQNQHLFQQGEGTRTDILEAESRYELATAEEIQALDEQDASLRALGALIGVQSVNIHDLAPLNQRFAAFSLTPANYDTWHALAISNNPTLASQRQALEVARYEVERNRAGHLPKITAYASSRQQESDSGNTYNQRYDTNTIGVEVSLPLYAGGAVSDRKS